MAGAVNIEPTPFVGEIPPTLPPMKVMGTSCSPYPSRFESLLLQTNKPSLPMEREGLFGWGGRIRTYECQIQNLVTYRLSTPQSALKSAIPHKKAGGLI